MTPCEMQYKGTKMTWSNGDAYETRPTNALQGQTYSIEVVKLLFEKQTKWINERVFIVNERNWKNDKSRVDKINKSRDKDSDRNHTITKIIRKTNWIDLWTLTENISILYVRFSILRFSSLSQTFLYFIFA